MYIIAKYHFERCFMANYIIRVFLLILPFLGLAYGQLSVNHYQSTCPNVASTVTQAINAAATQSNVVPPAILRMIMHDAFVQGCDASILIASTVNNQAERDYPDNQSIRQEGFDAIDKAKEAVEIICPGVVSCADILALAARDAVVISGGPTWDVPLGRLDGLVSSASNVFGKLPLPNFNVAQLTASFATLGLSVLDMVVLSGAHTIGFAHCDQFRDRLYNFDGTGAMDPSMNTAFGQGLEQKCPPANAGGDATTIVPFDPTSSLTFDNAYYADLQRGQGLLFSDQVLFMDPSTQAAVNQLASSQQLFFNQFVQSMVKLTSVISNQKGNIRKVCSKLNDT